MGSTSATFVILKVEVDVFTNTNILTLASIDDNPTYITKIELNDKRFADLAPKVGDHLSMGLTV